MFSNVHEMLVMSHHVETRQSALTRDEKLFQKNIVFVGLYNKKGPNLVRHLAVLIF